ncbi:MAG: hypothetical protein WCB04_05880 [Mycobacteriales bacterium]
MSDRIRMDFGSMAMGEAAIASSDAKLRGTAAEIKAATAKLASWEGADSAGYQAYQKAWDSIFDDVLVALNGMRQIVGTSADNGRTTEKANADMFNL